MLIIEFPDARVGFVPALANRLCRYRHCPPVLFSQHVQACGRSEHFQRFPQPVKLELADHLVPSPGGSGRIPAQPQSPFIGDGLAADRISGHQAGAVGKDPLGKEPNCSFQKRVRAVKRGRSGSLRRAPR